MSDPRKIDRADMVEALWPTIGPHTAESVIEAARGIEELWRYLAHATRNREAAALSAPADVYAAVGALKQGAHSAVQVVRQLQNWAAYVSSVDGLARDDDRADPERAAATADYAVDCLYDARQGMAQHAAALEQVAAALSHLYIADRGEVEEGQR
ncbi:hypothetical protein [Nocardia sp. CC227C]|uniref:hypothetical protein n=1 Tax=Nocardia sp. CC227C TaxID=3044562 RepID=UPI00278C4A8D|nr:hypothetical protein [Nocardia sp. CC227C]